MNKSFKSIKEHINENIKYPRECDCQKYLLNVMCLRHGTLIKGRIWPIVHSKYEENAKISNPFANTEECVTDYRVQSTHGVALGNTKRREKSKHVCKEKKENFKLLLLCH